MNMYKFGIKALANEPEKNKEIISFFERLGYYNLSKLDGNVGTFYDAVYAVGDSSNKIHCCVDPMVELLFDNVEEAEKYINSKVMNKEIKIEIPEGYEIDEENSTFECIKFKKKGLTYQDISERFFCTGDGYTIYTDNDGSIKRCKKGPYGGSNPNNCTSEKQAEKLLAINKLMNVAKYLNNGWKPDWSTAVEKKYYIVVSNNFSDNSKIIILYNYANNNSSVYFKTEELAKEAIRILGEDTIRLVCSTDY